MANEPVLLSGGNPQIARGQRVGAGTLKCAIWIFTKTSLMAGNSLTG